MRVPGRVTIAIPTFNRSRLAVRAIHSALAQNYPDLEVLVSDDVSADDTVQRVHQIQDSRLAFFPQPERLGLVGNFDFCLRHSTGEFFILVGDDDVLLPHAIERLAECFLSPPQGLSPESIGLAWCPCRIAGAEGAQYWITESGPDTESPASLLAELWAGRRGPRLSSILMRTRDALAAGGFLERHGHLCDLGTWGSAALLHDYVVCVNQPLVQYTNHHGSTTSKSAVRKWQNWARVVHADLVAGARERGPDAQERLKRARRNLISGITLTILIQTIGRRGWVKNACHEALRSPGAFFTPYVCRRFFHDGWKILRLRGNQTARA
jgi:glycosyltransferase involved in cell wall biosynthesis